MAKKAATTTIDPPVEEAPPAGDKLNEEVNLDDLKPDFTIDDEEDETPPPAAGDDEEEDEDETPPPAGEEGTPPPAGDGDDEEEDEEEAPPAGEEPPPAGEPPPTGAQDDDSDLEWLDNPDVTDEFGAADPVKQANFTQRVMTARQVEVRAIINDVRKSVPGVTPDDLADLESQLLTSPGGVRDLRTVRRNRTITGQIKLAVDEAVANGKRKPPKTDKAPPVPKRTPANGADEPAPVLTSREEAEIKAMLAKNPQMDGKALRASYIADKKKRKSG